MQRHLGFDRDEPEIFLLVLSTKSSLRMQHIAYDTASWSTISRLYVMSKSDCNMNNCVIISQTKI